MIRYWERRANGPALLPAGVVPAAADVVWIDLQNPTGEEERAVESLLGLQVPTRQEMSEIEESARLYREGGALVMTAAVVTGVAEKRPVRADITFLLTADHLVTVRYSDPLPFRTFAGRLAKHPEDNRTAPAILLSLLESLVERIADVLEIVASDLHGCSTAIFYDDDEARADGERPDLRALIRQLGRRNRLLAILRESLLSLGRILPFLRQGADGWLKGGLSARIKAIARDLNSLGAFESQLEQEIGFLHEATLGLINLEQNAIIKVFSVAAVLFLPPTLVGTIYGMNFQAMPELNWKFGYPFALGTMVVSAIVPYWWFKRRGWL
ncbi:magnesium/cobalt transporter [Allostella sp. ATCC 35155]|nr:magnesium/cobalt transporter [Stella sp. ATCC 35155]